MRLTERIHLVGGADGERPSDRLDAQIYVVDTSDGLVAIDAGAGRRVDAVVDAIRDDGLDPSSVRWLLLTHAHADHAGGAAGWRRAMPQVEVLASPDVAGWLVDADEEATSVDRARAAGIYPAGYRLEPCAVGPVGGTTLRLGALAVEVVQTPGHAAGHLAFLAEIDGATTIFSGDALFPEDRKSVV